MKPTNLKMRAITLIALCTLASQTALAGSMKGRHASMKRMSQSQARAIVEGRRIPLNSLGDVAPATQAPTQPEASAAEPDESSEAGDDEANPLGIAFELVGTVVVLAGVVVVGFVVVVGGLFYVLFAIPLAAAG
ncbi:MAG: hypothetical protein ACI8W8_002974 [Rhodothermales bacterium]|jgi:hypothetical protein